MPSTRARHQIVETDEIAAAIETAAPLFPDETRTGVVRQLVLAGAESLAADRRRHRAVVEAHATGFPGVYRDPVPSESLE